MNQLAVSLFMVVVLHLWSTDATLNGGTNHDDHVQLGEGKEPSNVTKLKNWLASVNKRNTSKGEVLYMSKELKRQKSGENKKKYGVGAKAVNQKNGSSESAEDQIPILPQFIEDTNNVQIDLHMSNIQGVEYRAVTIPEDIIAAANIPTSGEVSISTFATILKEVAVAANGSIYYKSTNAIYLIRRSRSEAVKVLPIIWDFQNMEVTGNQIKLHLQVKAIILDMDKQTELKRTGEEGLPIEVEIRCERLASDKTPGASIAYEFRPFTSKPTPYFDPDINSINGFINFGLLDTFKEVMGTLYGEVSKAAEMYKKNKGSP